jgi:hypothetical protein
MAKTRFSAAPAFTKKAKTSRKRKRKSSSGRKGGNAWRKYVSGGAVSNAPLPD